MSAEGSTSDGESQRRDYLLCANCFNDPGLKLMASGSRYEEARCPNCGILTDTLLCKDDLLELSEQFFVRGSIHYTDFGGSPTIQFNELQSGSLEPDEALAKDVLLLQEALGIGFFHYGPRLWMLGHIEPLERLRDEATRPSEIARLIELYPTAVLTAEDKFYRIRKAPLSPADRAEYDAPPTEFCGFGRLDTAQSPILYASQDIEVCVHECRFAVGDDLYIATIRPTRDLHLLDLSAVLDEDETEFESLDLAVLMIFLAGSHGYSITRDIALAARELKFDGIIYPSFFSVIRTGSIPFETAYGLSLRRMPSARDYEKAKVIPNIALFGRPISDKRVTVDGVNRMVITQARYSITLGPVTY